MLTQCLVRYGKFSDEATQPRRLGETSDAPEPDPEEEQRQHPDVASSGVSSAQCVIPAEYGWCAGWYKKLNQQNKQSHHMSLNELEQQDSANLNEGFEVSESPNQLNHHI